MGAIRNLGGEIIRSRFKRLLGQVVARAKARETRYQYLVLRKRGNLMVPYPTGDVATVNENDGFGGAIGFGGLGFKRQDLQGTGFL